MEGGRVKRVVILARAVFPWQPEHSSSHRAAYNLHQASITLEHVHGWLSVPYNIEELPASADSDRYCTKYHNLTSFFPSLVSLRTFSRSHEETCVEPFTDTASQNCNVLIGELLSIPGVRAILICLSKECVKLRRQSYNSVRYEWEQVTCFVR